MSIWTHQLLHITDVNRGLEPKPKALKNKRPI